MKWTHSPLGLLFSVLWSAALFAKPIALGNWHTCAITSNSTTVCAATGDCAPITSKDLLCWGDNYYGQLGNGKSGSGNQINPTPNSVLLAPDDSMKAVTAGFSHTCTLLESGAIKCWGSNDSGQLGNDLSNLSESKPMSVVGIDTAKSVVAGAKHTCAVLADGTVSCWGKNASGQLGNGTTLDSKIPAEVSGINDAEALAAGANHSCALTQTGSVRCWGSNEFGQLGNNSQVNSSLPVTVANPTGEKAIALSAGSDHTCAVLEDHSLWCWGWNGHSQQGPKLQSGNNLSPVGVSGFATIKDLALGSDATCALDPTGKVRCLGGNWFGNLGNGEFGKDDKDQPTLAVGIDTALMVAAGGVHTCAVLSDKTLRCWGTDDFGEIGVDPKSATLQSSTNPIKVLSSFPVTLEGVQVDAPSPADAVVPLGGEDDSNRLFREARFRPDENFRTSRRRPLSYQLRWLRNDDKDTGSERKKKEEDPFPVEKSWLDQEVTITGLLNDLAKATVEKASARGSLKKGSLAAMEPYLKDLLKGGKAAPLSGMTPVPGKKTYDAALQKQKDTFVKLNSLLTGLLTLKTDPKVKDPKTQNVLVQVAIVYFNALLTAIIDEPLTGKINTCTADPIKNQSLYAIMKSPDSGVSGALSTAISMLQCLPQASLNRLDEGVFEAFKLTFQIIQATRPNYAQAIQDSLLSRLVPIALNIHEKTRFQGQDVPTKAFLKMYVERLNGIPPNMKAPPETGVALEPPLMMLYNPVTKQAVGLPFCSDGVAQELASNPVAGQLPTWSDKYQCLVFKNFVKAATDPAMNPSLSCAFWNTARLGKPCLPAPAPKTGSFDVDRVLGDVKHLLAGIQGAFIPVAHAGNPFETCEDKGMETDACGACVPKASGGQTPPPKTQCEVLCGYCEFTENCWSTLHCPFDASKKMYCTKPIYAADGKTIACPGGNCQAEPCSEMQKAYGNCPNLPLCPECSKCAHDNAVNICNGYVKACYDNCYQNNKAACSVVCGNMKLEPGEECDDGNKTPGDGCNGACKKEALCGNKKIETGEECDDGNSADGDGCDKACKKPKKWCAECYPPIFQNKKCAFYDQLKQDYKNNPACTNPVTELDEDGCIMYKKAEPCASALHFARERCLAVRIACVQECEKKEGPPPPPDPSLITKEKKLACLEAESLPLPSWLNGFGEKTKEMIAGLIKQGTEAVDYGKNVSAFKNGGAELLQQHWWTVVGLLEKTSGLEFDPKDVDEALEYALQLLSEPKACPPEPKVDAIAYYDPDFEFICWDPDYLKDLFEKDAAATGAHEGIHAAVDHLWNLTASKQSVKEPCASKEWDTGGLEHWMMSVLHASVPGFPMTPVGNFWEMKSSVCPYVLQEK